MLPLLKKITLYLLLLLAFGEVTTRMFKKGVLIPAMYQDSSGLLMNFPDQKGIYINENQFTIGKYGYTGRTPDTTKQMISVIGDSFIEALMNPDSCHQSEFLQQFMPQEEIFPCGISSENLVSMIEHTRILNRTGKFKTHLLYVHHSDFWESLDELYPINQFRYSATRNQIIKPIFNQASQNRKYWISSTFQFPYFIFRKLVSPAKPSGAKSKSEPVIEKHSPEEFAQLKQLIDFIKSHTDISKIVMVFIPDTDERIIAIARNAGFRTYWLKAENYDIWQHEHDNHWNCGGHKEAARQVSEYMESLDAN